MRQMIRNICILLFGIITIFACNSRQETTSVSNKVEEETIQNINSIVRSEWLANTEDRKSRMYFIAENNDTSIYMFLVRNFIYSNEFVMEVSDISNMKRGNHKVKDIEGIMNELDSCLYAISLDYQIDSLKFLELPLAFMGDVLLEFNRELDKNRYSDEYYFHHPELLNSALCATSLNSRVESIMKKHGLNICETQTRWCLFFGKEHFLKTNIVSDSSKVPEHQTSAYITYRLEPIQ